MIDLISKSLDQGIRDKIELKGRLTDWDHTKDIPEFDDETLDSATEDTTDCMFGNMFSKIYLQFSNAVANMLAEIVVDLEAQGKYVEAQKYKVKLSDKQIIELMTAYMTDEGELNV